VGFRMEIKPCAALLLLVPAAVLPCALTSVLAGQPRCSGTRTATTMCLCACDHARSDLQRRAAVTSEGGVPAQRRYPGAFVPAQPVDAGDADCMLTSITVAFWQFSSSERGHWIAECHSQHAMVCQRLPDDNERATSVASRSQQRGCSLAASPTRRQRVMHASG
jgi:hypothetical protein